MSTGSAMGREQRGLCVRLLHWLKRTGASLAHGLLLGLALPALSQAPSGPAPGASCVVSAQNRSTPLAPHGGYILNNLPGNGLVPFGVEGHAQPFRVRVTCDDGSRGDTDLVFPTFGETEVTVGDFVWGRSTRVPSKLELRIPKDRITRTDGPQQLQLTAFYAGTSADVTARASGTGYRSSAPALLGVSGSGQVFFQPSAVQQIAGGILGLPSQVAITAENDGVVASRVLKVSSGSALTGMVQDAVSGGAPGRVVSLSLPGQQPLVLGTDSAGRYAFNDLPLTVSPGAVADVIAMDPMLRSATRREILVPAEGATLQQNLWLPQPGAVRIWVKNPDGGAAAGVSVAVRDELARLFPGQLLPAKLTGADGSVYFERVAAGTVVPLLPVSTEPFVGGTSLAAGGLLEMTLQLRRPAGAETGSLRGLVEYAGHAPALGALVELREDGTERLVAREVVDGSGRFRVEGLQAGGWYRPRVLIGPGVVPLGGFVIQAGENSRTLTIPSGVLGEGTVLKVDGLTPAANVDLTINRWEVSIPGWQFVTTMRSDAQGRFYAGLLPKGRVQVVALAADRATATREWDFSVVEGAPRVRLDLVLQAPPTGVVKLRIKPTVLGLPGPLDASPDVWVENSDCVAGCLLGQANPSTGFLTNPLPKGPNRFELRWGSRVERFTAEVGEAREEVEVIERRVDFVTDVAAATRFAAQRSVYSFEGLVGQRLDLYAAGVRVSPEVDAARQLRLRLYDPTGQEVQNLYRTDAASYPGLAQVRTQVELAKAGRYHLVVAPDNSSADALGGYGLLANFDGQPASLTAWTATPAARGGLVRGQVKTAKGLPADQRTVQLSAGSAEGPSQVERVQTDAQGRYEYGNLLLGAVKLEALDGAVVQGKADTSLTTEGETKEQDLLLLARTKVRVTARFSAGARPLADALLQARDEIGEKDHRLTFAPGAFTAVQELTLYGGPLRLRLGHPILVAWLLEKELAADDEATVNVEMPMPSGALVGQFKTAMQEPLADQVVRVLDGQEQVLAESRTGPTGEFRFAQLPAGTALTVRGEDDLTSQEVSAVEMVAENGERQMPALVLPSGRLTGLVVRDGAGAVAVADVFARWPGGPEIMAVTNFDGRYVFGRVPANVVVHVSTIRNASGDRVYESVLSVLAQELQIEDLVVDAVDGAVLRGRVVNASGGPVRGARVSATESFEGSVAPEPHFSSEYVLTDSNGYYVIVGVPVSAAPLMVRASLNSPLGGSQDSKVIAREAGRYEYVVPNLVLESTADLNIRLVDASGRPTYLTRRSIAGECGDQLWIHSNEGLEYDQYFEESDVVELKNSWVFNGAKVGTTYTASIRNNCYSERPQVRVGTVTVPGDVESVDLKIVIPMLKGTARYANGEPVEVSATLLWGAPNGEIYSSWLDSYDFDHWPGGITEHTVIASGEFGVGPVRLQLRPIMSNLVFTKTFDFQVPTDVVEDFVFPPAVKVHGCVTRADGSPAVLTGVLLRVQEYGSHNPEVTGNCFESGRVGAGKVRLQVFDVNGETMVTWLDVPQPQVDLTPLRQDIQLRKPEPLQLTVFSQPGVRAPNVYVYASSTELALGGGVGGSARTSLMGEAVLNLLPDDYWVYRWADVGKAWGGEVQLPIGGIAKEFPRDSTIIDLNPPSVSEGAVSFQISTGNISSSGSNWEHTTLTRAYIDGAHIYWPREAIGLTGPQTQVTVAKSYLKKLQVTRSLYVPPEGGFGRMLDTFSNVTDEPQTIRFRIGGEGPGGGVPCHTGATTLPLLSADRGYFAYGCKGRLGHVYGGRDGSLLPVRVSTFPEMSTEWEITVPPRTTRSLLHFLVVSDVGNDLSLDALADSLAKLTHPRALEQLTPQERSQVLNFTQPLQ